MGKMSREKGAREERIIVEWFKSMGLTIRRTAASGAQSGYEGDFEVELLGQTFTGEGKARASGFRSIYKWLDSHAFLTCRANGEKPIVVCSQWFFEHLIGVLLAQHRQLTIEQNENLQMEEDRSPEEVLDGPHEGGWHGAAK